MTKTYKLKKTNRNDFIVIIDAIDYYIQKELLVLAEFDIPNANNYKKDASVLIEIQKSLKIAQTKTEYNPDYTTTLKLPFYKAYLLSKCFSLYLNIKSSKPYSDTDAIVLRQRYDELATKF